MRGRFVPSKGSGVSGENAAENNAYGAGTFGNALREVLNRATPEDVGLTASDRAQLTEACDHARAANVQTQR